MKLKRQLDEHGKCTHMLIKHTGVDAEQNFSLRLVEQGLVEGWAFISGTKLTIKAQPEDLIYTLKRTPGYYCISSGERIPISETAWARMRSRPDGGDLSRREALAWLKVKGKPEADYEVTLAYECVLLPKLHEKYHAIEAATGAKVAANTLEA